MAVIRIRIAKGSHCQDTMITMDASGCCASQSTGCAPKNFHTAARMPETG